MEFLLKNFFSRKKIYLLENFVVYTIGVCIRAGEQVVEK